MRKLLHKVFIPIALIKESGKLTLGNLLSFIITIVGYPIIARLYPDDMYGSFALFQAICLILIQVSVFGYHEALILIKQETDFKLLFSQLIVLLLLSSLLAMIIVILCSSTINQFVSNYAWFIPFTMFIGGINLLNQYAFLRQKRFGLVSKLKVLDRGAFQSVVVAWGTFFNHGNGIIIGFVAGHVVSLIVSISAVIKNFVGIKNLRSSVRQLKFYINFPRYSILAGLLTKIIQHLPILILPLLVNKSVTGQFALAYRVLSIPEVILGVGIAQVFYLRIAERFNQKKPIKENVISLWVLLAAIGIAPTLVIMFFGEELFVFIFGSNWILAGELSSILAPMIYFLFVTSASSAVYSVLQKQKHSLVYTVIHFAGRICCLYFGFMKFELKTAILVMIVVDIIIGIGYYFNMLRQIHNYEEILVE